MTDICITWPKTRPLESYLIELDRAIALHRTINYRVSSQPKKVTPGDYCFVVHDGYVRGYNVITGVNYYNDDVISRVPSDPLWPGGWPAGWYVVRAPDWHELIDPVARKGFQGYRYVTLEEKSDYLKAYCGETR